MTMTTTIRTTLAAALVAVTLAPAVTASAATFAPARAPVEAAAGIVTVASERAVRVRRAETIRQRFSARAGKGHGSGYPAGNVASAWTAACYAEFGPAAKYPDAALLEKCLSY